ncbi:hypothetical protein ABKW33_09765 [Sanguibacter sp. 26GB23]
MRRSKLWAPSSSSATPPLRTKGATARPAACINGGFQPAPFTALTCSSETLSAIADLAESVTARPPPTRSNITDGEALPTGVGDLELINGETVVRFVMGAVTVSPDATRTAP